MGFPIEMYKIMDFNKKYRTGGKTSYGSKDKKLNADFEDCKSWFDSKTHESMTRERIKNKDAIKMIQPFKVILGCMMLTLAKKGVDKVVR